MAEVTDEQVAAVATRIDEQLGDTLNDHDQNVELFVVPGVTINGGAQLLDDATPISAGMRQLSARIDASAPMRTWVAAGPARRQAHSPLLVHIGLEVSPRPPRACPLLGALVDGT
jgi:hypothetical protein